MFYWGCDYNINLRVMSEGKRVEDEEERGFYDPDTNTFYKVKSEEIYQKVLEFMEQQAKKQQ